MNVHLRTSMALWRKVRQVAATSYDRTVLTFAVLHRAILNPDPKPQTLNPKLFCPSLRPAGFCSLGRHGGEQGRAPLPKVLGQPRESVRLLSKFRGGDESCWADAGSGCVFWHLYVCRAVGVLQVPFGGEGCQEVDAGAGALDDCSDAHLRHQALRVACSRRQHIR